MRSATTGGALLLGVAGVALAAIGGDVGCSPNKATEIVPGAMTQVRVPKDLTGITVEVLAQNSRTFCGQYAVDQNGIVLLPSTLGVQKGSASTTITIIVRGYDNLGDDWQNCGATNVGDTSHVASPPRVLRRSTTTYVSGHTLFLPMQISFSCYDNSSCTDSQTCKAGTCVDATVDPNTLADYDPSLMDGTQTCFSPSTCFNAQATVDATVVDAATCTYAAPQAAGSNFNVRVAYAQGAFVKDPGTGEQVYQVGAPFEGEILSQDTAEGYTLDPSHPGQFKLTPGLCNLVKAATPPSQPSTKPVPVISDVQVAAGCAPKQLLLPFCQAEQNGNVNDNPPPVACGVAVPLTESASAVYVLVDNSVAMDSAFGPTGYATAMALSFADPVFKKTYVAFDFLHHNGAECGSTTTYLHPAVTDFDLSANVRTKIAPVVLQPTFPDQGTPGTPAALDLGAALQATNGAYGRISNFISSITAVTKQQNPLNEPSLMVVVNRIPVDPNALGDGGAGDAGGGLDPKNAGTDCPNQTPDVQTALANQVSAAGQAGLHTFFVVLNNHQNNGQATKTFFDGVASKVSNASVVDVVDATSSDSNKVFSQFQSKIGGAVTCAYDLPPGIDTTATLTLMVPPNTPGFPPSTVPLPVPIPQASGCSLATKNGSVSGWNVDNGRIVVCGTACTEVQAAIGAAISTAYQKSGVLTDAGINFDGGNIDVPDVPVAATMPCH